jgi:putative transposase
MKFGFVDEHRHIWPARVMCTVLGLSVGGYYAWRSRVMGWTPPDGICVPR